MPRHTKAGAIGASPAGSGPLWATVIRTRGCQAELLLDFLKYNDAATIYLVGDMIDGWQLKNGWYWPQAHNDVVQKLLRKVRKGARMIYVPNNHDEFARGYIGCF